MENQRSLNLQPVSILPTMADVVESQLEVFQKQREKLSEICDRPGSMDDATIDRVLRVYSESKELLPVYHQHIAFWRTEPLSGEQVVIIDRMEQQLVASLEEVDRILALATEIKPKTIEALMARSDIELGMRAMAIGTGKR